MSVTTLAREVRRICGEPARGRPSAECSEILRMLRASCAAKPNHTLVKRQCRPKIKPGRPKKAKPAAKPAVATKRSVARPKAKSASYAKRSIKKYTPGPRSVSRKVGMPPLPARQRSPKIKYCPDIRFTAEELRFLRNPVASASKKAALRGRCDSKKNSLGRPCAVRMRTGKCVTRK